MASRYTEMMMPTRKLVVKVTRPQMPVQMPPVMVVSICWAPGSTCSVSTFMRSL